MELDKVIPDNSKNWIIRGEFLFFEKIHLIPLCTIIDDIYYVMLDARLHNQVLKLAKNLMKMNVEFYFTTPLISNPAGVDNLNSKVIETYIHSWTNKYFFRGFKKIDFDLIHNMVKWTEKENCFDLVKDIYDRYEKIVSQEYYDYYANRKFYSYDEEIRESFKGLYRDIQISKLL